MLLFKQRSIKNVVHRLFKLFKLLKLVYLLLFPSSTRGFSLLSSSSILPALSRKPVYIYPSSSLQDAIPLSLPGPYPPHPLQSRHRSRRLDRRRVFKHTHLQPELGTARQIPRRANHRHVRFSRSNGSLPDLASRRPLFRSRAEAGSVGRVHGAQYLLGHTVLCQLRAWGARY